ncbi:isochorismate synthase [Schaalia vaccimaxillae]|uniref:isochorismate synthase n=1 Tax=Schaalia vaccimaxillae TaxID=183916 RepID=UPI0003B4F29A|nr:chorismate-binding protein [Schaalia vaccimaxillae]
MLEASDPATPLHIRAFRVPSDLPFADVPLLSLLPESAAPLVWLSKERSMVGFGRAAHLTFGGDHAIGDAGRAFNQLAEASTVEAPDSAPAVPVAFASFGFSPSTPSVLAVPEILIIDDEDGRWAVSASSTGPAPDPLSILGNIWGHIRPAAAPTGLRTDVGKMTQDEWTASVQTMSERLRAGEASKAVMTRDLPVLADTRIDERFLLSRLSDLYPDTWRFCVDGLVGATPEMLGAAHAGRLESRVLAGTAAPGAGDSLMESAKDRSEHELAVSSVVDALAPLVSDLCFADTPFVLDLPNVSHLATDISASLNGIGLLDTVEAVHPTAAVCGTPRIDALRLLGELERTERGRYSGPVGWIDAGGEGEFALALRCGQLEDDGRTLRLFAGGGIMPDSDPEAELAETRAKMKPLLDALGL